VENDARESRLPRDFSTTPWATCSNVQFSLLRFLFSCISSQNLPFSVDKELVGRSQPEDNDQWLDVQMDVDDE